jgi:nitrogen fixation/metabolism regulation signal transduction histidine kinase
MGFKKFSLHIIIRTILAILTLALLTQVILAPGYHATSIFIAALLIFQLTEFIRFVEKTNIELVRFFDAMRHADFSQRFDLKQVGTGFDELGLAFTEILDKLQTARTSQEAELRHLKAIVEHVPTPLLSIHQNNQVTLWNNSARRLFGTNTITHGDDFEQFSQGFSKQLNKITIGEYQLISIDIDGMQHQLMIGVTEIMISQQKERLFSLQDIRSELDIAQLQAWQDLVRVLTHEIMNSITPVASLAKTAVILVDDLKEKTNADTVLKNTLNEDIDDIIDAVQTVARRSDSLMQFVSSYRRLTRLPPPKKKRIELSIIFEQVKILLQQDWQNNDINLTINITPRQLDLFADPDMTEQILINLLKNAEQALTNVKTPHIMLSAFLNPRGRTVIEVSDNGEGITDDVAAKVFVPFFTTKKEGSGVGLALTRQMMIAHGGNIRLLNNDDSDVTFRLTF